MPNCGCEPTSFLGPSLATTCGPNFVVFMSLIDTFIRKQCIISDLCGRVHSRPEPEPEYDFIVIGGGSGGSTAAGRLADVKKWKTLLVETGPDEPPGSQVPSMVTRFFGNPDTDYNYRTEPEPVGCQGYDEKRCIWPRGRMLGGSSVVNGMMYTRGTRADYKRWVDAGNEGWGYDDILPIFKRFEDNQDVGRYTQARYHGTKGPLTISRFPHQPEMTYDLLKAAKEIGYPTSQDINGDDFSGFAFAQANIRHGARLSMAKAYVRPHRNNPNFHVMLNTTATRLIFRNTSHHHHHHHHNSKLIATEVELLHNGKKYYVRARKEIILAGGAINTPQILMLSGVGPRDELNKVGIEQIHNLPGVGKNLKNHVSFFIEYELTKIPGTNDLNWATALDYILYQKGPMSATGLAQLTARISSPYANPDGSDPDMQFFFHGYEPNCSYTGNIGEPEDPQNPHGPKVVEFNAVNLQPKSSGYIGLHSKDPLHAPKMVANYLTAPEDIKVVLAGVRVAQKLANTKVLREKYGIRLKPTEYGHCHHKHKFDSDEYWECAIKYRTGPENHQACSCKMGPETDELAVVNGRLLVHGINNVRIMDASAMPALVSGNTQATIMLLAERGVDFIKERWLEDEDDNESYEPEIEFPNP